MGNRDYVNKRQIRKLSGRVMAILLCMMVTLANSVSAVKVSSLSGMNTATKQVRIGLANMFAEKLAVTLSDDYSMSVGDLFFTPGTSFTLQVLDGKLSYDYGICDSLVLSPKKADSTIKLEFGAKKYSYRGSMSFSVKAGKITPVNILDIETYLKGVVGYEMSNSYPLEALKAQAIAARNYTLASLNKHSKDGYDLCDTTDCQVYKGENLKYANVIKAVDESRNQVLVYGDELVGAYYGASCGGYTEASGNIWSKQLPYLIVKKDEFENESWPYGNMVFTGEQMDKKIKEKKYLKTTDTFLTMDLNSIKRNASERVSSFEISYLDADGVEKKKSISKDGARTFLSLPSANFQVEYDLLTDTYTFSGKGYGHGVGMSQIGAKNRAKAGQTHREILAFYYDGSKLVNLSKDIVNTTTDSSINLPDSTTGSPVKVPDSTTGQGVDKPSGTTNPSIVVPGSKPANEPVGSKNNTELIPPSKPDTTDVPKVPVVQTGKNSTTTSAVNMVPDKNDVASGIGATKTSGTTVKTIVKIENYSFTRELKKGMKGDDVKKLQDLLKKLKYFSEAKTTTFFGAVTEKSIQSFQKKHGVKMTGMADKSTLLKLGQAYTAMEKPNNTAVTVVPKGTTASKSVNAAKKSTTVNSKTAKTTNEVAAKIYTSTVDGTQNIKAGGE